MPAYLSDFSSIWLVDFEFSAPSGGLPEVRCLVAHEFRSGKRLRFWEEELQAMSVPPYSTGPESLFVAYYASAEMGCHLALGWPLPDNVIDLFVEFRNLTNGAPVTCGNGLIGALTYFGLDTITAVEKAEMRDLAIRGGPYTLAERQALLDYCESDVFALERLLLRMEGNLDVPRALLRGRYMKAVARIETAGIPIDVRTFEAIRDSWEAIQDALILAIDADYHIFIGRTFKADLFKRYLITHRLAWPQDDSGRLQLDEDTFREMSRVYPQINPLRELRASLSQMRLSALAVGPDGRNRCLLSPFSARTGRNQPSNTRLIFGPAVWLRSLIQPEPGFSIAYVDWEQQEFGIAAALSGDPAMTGAYQSGDPYLTFGKQINLIPEHGTKATHGPARDLAKATILGTQYGMEADSLARRIQKSPAFARQLLAFHREVYRRFWEWSDASINFAMLHGYLCTVFGWRIRTGGDVNPRSLRNFPMQANGAEMLRLACCLATEAGIRVCAPVHDAILIEAPTNQIEKAMADTQDLMAKASRVVLAGFELRTEAKVFSHPNHYEDERGKAMWSKVCHLLNRLGDSFNGEHMCAGAQVPVSPCDTRIGT